MNLRPTYEDILDVDIVIAIFYVIYDCLNHFYPSR